MCKNCKTKPVIKLKSGDTLCKSCFIKYFERKAKKTISKFRMIGSDDHVAVGLSGGKDSSAMLYILAGIARNHENIRVTAISIDEGISGYRNVTLKQAALLCRRLGVSHKVYSFKKEFGYSLDGMVKRLDESPCTVCGVFRRYLLNKYSRKLKVNRLATGHNMDDEAQSVVMNQFRSNVAGSARLGPVTGVVDDPRFVRRVKPFYLLEEKEVLLYSFLKKLPYSSVECPYAHSAYRSEVRDMLNDFESRHPGVKNNVMSSFLAVLPLLKGMYGGKVKSIRTCACGEPSAGETCKACQLLGKLGD